MKTSFYTLLQILIPFFVFAQIPNGGFENWTSVSTYSVPNNWGTLNNTYTVQTATKATPGNPGNSFLKLTSKTYGSSVINAIAVSGVLDSITSLPKSGFPFNQQPLNLTGKWQYMSFGSSQGSIQVLLTRWDSNLGVRVPVASGLINLSGMVMSWASFTVPLSYVDSNLPDSCIIVLKASGANPANNDYLWVDDLNFTGTATSIHEPSPIKELFIHPNPTNETISFNFKTTYAAPIEVNLFDITGKMIYSENIGIVDGLFSYKINLPNLSKGIYIIKLNSLNSTITQKLFIN